MLKSSLSESELEKINVLEQYGYQYGYQFEYLPFKIILFQNLPPDFQMAVYTNPQLKKQYLQNPYAIQKERPEYFTWFTFLTTSSFLISTKHYILKNFLKGHIYNLSAINFLLSYFSKRSEPSEFFFDVGVTLCITAICLNGLEIAKNSTKFRKIFFKYGSYSVLLQMALIHLGTTVNI
eukprot:TRINITY_DN1160_c1_g1_i1.p1 TRINITY_DN1160_c1_g1~~TRINITY_DN1160_c1_g1_i1.p1  ORF type:complete len:179 (-),score=39.28 TRINITY_DN1160_c1_g1_i1:44-580(-)